MFSNIFVRFFCSSVNLFVLKLLQTSPNSASATAGRAPAGKHKQRTVLPMESVGTWASSTAKVQAAARPAEHHPDGRKQRRALEVTSNHSNQHRNTKAELCGVFVHLLLASAPISFGVNGPAEAGRDPEPISCSKL